MALTYENRKQDIMAVAPEQKREFSHLWIILKGFIMKEKEKTWDRGMDREILISFSIVTRCADTCSHSVSYSINEITYDYPCVLLGIVWRYCKRLRCHMFSTTTIQIKWR
jgi:hypothetical protein